MSMERKDYENIQIPTEVSGIMQKVRLRKRKVNTRIFTEIAIVFAVFMVSSNTPIVYAAILDIPVIGDVVKIFHIGSGGGISDALKINMAADEEHLTLTFSRNTDANEPVSAVPAYHIEEFAAPDRIVITVNGIRSYDYEAFMQEAKKCSYYKNGLQRNFFG